jgi:Putative MetA-pathway of phenol degradation
VIKFLSVLILPLLYAAVVHAQGGPPFYTNDPGTPGPFNWEINIAYMPFYYSNQSVSHVPDLDINFGLGERIQLTYENAWLRVQPPAGSSKYGLGQSNPGVKWRFYDSAERGLAISVFPQFFLNNPGDADKRGITPPHDSFLLPVEVSKKIGPIDLDAEFGYQFVHSAPDTWLTGLVVGHDFSHKLELDAELYATGSFHPADNQTTIGFGGRYKLHRPIILLFMAGRSLQSATDTRPYFIGYFGIQLLLPPKSYPSETPSGEGEPH